MRDFNECKAEVLRRSEKRIKERERKKKILLVMLPVVICPLLVLNMIVWAILPASFVLPMFMKAEATPSDSVAADNASGESFVMLLEVTDLGTGEKVVISDPGDIEEISNIFEDTLYFLYGAPPGAAQGTPDENKNNDIIAPNAPCNYTFTFVDSSGGEITYKIQDGFLICEETDVKSKLDAAELRRIETIINS